MKRSFCRHPQVASRELSGEPCDGLDTMPTLRPPRFADDVATAVLNNDARTLATYLSYKDHHCRDLVNSTVNIVRSRSSCA